MSKEAQRPFIRYGSFPFAKHQLKPRPAGPDAPHEAESAALRPHDFVVCAISFDNSLHIFRSEDAEH